MLLLLLNSIKDGRKLLVTTSNKDFIEMQTACFGKK